MADFKMPSLGADMTHGTLLEWMVAPGAAVKRGDIVALIDTSKAEIEAEAFEDGVIEELLVAPGTRVPVGTPRARIRSAGAAPAATGTPSAGQGLTATPAAGPDLTATPAAGQDLTATPAPPPAGTAALHGSERQAAMREAIGQLMTRSKREIPHYYLQREIDMTAASAWLAERNGERAPAERILPAALLLAAVARAAARTPAMNGLYTDGAFHPADSVRLGVAVALRGGGLIAPALQGAERMSVPELMAGLRDLVARGRTGALRSSEAQTPTITVTNLGEQGADLVHGVIYAPQVALVGFGRVRERPWAQGGMLGVRPTVQASLAADHRVSDGRTGSRFLAAIDALLQSPEEL